MIESFEVKKLNGKISGFYEFKKDLNILTGKNGCGKTTILKLLWYILSGNHDKIFDEMHFELAEISLSNKAKISMKVFKDKDDKEQITFTAISPKFDVNFKKTSLVSDFTKETQRYHSEIGSLFFPTFRRIEGGFSVDSRLRHNSRMKPNRLREALDSISGNLSTTANHRFISSLSTEDIDYLLSRKYANLSEEIRKLEINQSKKILNIVATSDKKEKESLEKIKKIVKENDGKKNEILRPFNVLSSLTTKIFKEKAIKISSNLELGGAKEAILSDRLSAGEKQMLSFLCYNFFVDNSVIFIDEPELSLHTDWQRLLFPTLLKQKKNNQFIIATHSPFIYSKYEDKEIIINEDKGNTNE